MGASPAVVVVVAVVVAGSDTACFQVNSKSSIESRFSIPAAANSEVAAVMMIFDGQTVYQE